MNKLKLYRKMDKKIIKFDDFEIQKYKFHQIESHISINDIGINKIVVSNKLPFGKQDFIYFIGYNDDKKIRPICIFFPKRNAQRIDFDETECMHFMIKEEKLFGKYMEFRKKVSNIKKN